MIGKTKSALTATKWVILQETAKVVEGIRDQDHLVVAGIQDHDLVQETESVIKCRTDLLGEEETVEKGKIEVGLGMIVNVIIEIADALQLSLSNHMVRHYSLNFITLGDRSRPNKRSHSPKKNFDRRSPD